MHKRVNITLPDETLKLIDRIAEKGDRSRFIDAAVRRYAKELRKKNLASQLEEGYRQNAALDRAVASDWFVLDEEAWHKSER